MSQLSTCSPLAHQRPSASLAAPAAAGQGVGTTPCECVTNCGDMRRPGDVCQMWKAEPSSGQAAGAINVDDQVHMSLSDVFAQLCDAGFSVTDANKAIYQSLDRLGYLVRGA